MKTLKNKKILVTGALGFIGKALILELENSGFRLAGIDINDGKIGKVKISSMNLLNEKQLDRFFRKNQFGIIVHLAARVPKSDDDQSQKLSLIENTASTLNILEAFKNSRAQKLIYASGISVVAQRESLYVISKYFGEILSQYYQKKFNKHVIILRISSPYGIGQSSDNVIPIFIKNALKNKKIQIFGTGRRSQDFIYVDDVARAILAALKHNCSGVYNIGSGQETSTIDLAKIILKNLPSSKSKIVFSDKKDPQENYHLNLDINKAKNDLKFSPEIMIEEGIKKYIKNFRKN